MRSFHLSITHGNRINIEREREIRGEQQKGKQVGEKPDNVKREEKIEAELLQTSQLEVRSGTGTYGLEEWGERLGGCLGLTALSVSQGGSSWGVVGGTVCQVGRDVLLEIPAL